MLKFPLTYDATITREDFIRLLPAATGDASLQATAEGFRGRGWSIRLTPLPTRVIGLARLVQHRVELQFEGMSEAEQDAFMRRFTHHYQRGGG